MKDIFCLDSRETNEGDFIKCYLDNLLVACSGWNCMRRNSKLKLAREYGSTLLMADIHAGRESLERKPEGTSLRLLECLIYHKWQKVREWRVRYLNALMTITKQMIKISGNFWTQQYFCRLTKWSLKTLTPFIKLWEKEMNEGRVPP